MIRGLYTSATGMMAQYQKMDTITNNLANVNTTGYKKDEVITSSFQEELTKRINDISNYPLKSKAKNIGKMSLGVQVDEIFTNFTQGSLKETQDSFDLALEGPGFFTIRVQEGNESVERYTRDGSFELDDQNRMITTEGYIVMGQEGEIIVPDGDMMINEAGEIFVEGEYIDQLQLISFEDPSVLRKIGDNLLSAENASFKPFTGKVVQGFLESANVNPVREMVDMITSLRVYEASQKALQTQDQTLEKIINEVGKV